MTDPGPGHDEVRQMQAGVRDWARRAARHGEHGLRTASPTVLLSVLCASAVGPVVAAGAGLTEAAAVAGVGVVSSVGGNILSAVITSALDRLRERGRTGLPPRDLEAGIAQEIQEALAAGGAGASALRAEIAGVLAAIDAGGTALRAAIEDGSEQARRDVIAAFGELGDGFAELRFLLGGVERAAGQIQAAQDEQGAQLRVLIDKVGWAGTEARLAREAAAAWRDRPGADAGPDLPWAGTCPYRGLLPFTEAEAGVFYGRERLTAELAGKLAWQAGRTGIVIVTGASGAGKSSLLCAGLLPALARGLQLPGSQDWPRIVMTPAGQPLAELASHLAALGGATASAVRDSLSADPANAHLAVRQAVLADAARRAAGPAGRGGARLVLVVDQFEQVFAPGSGEGGERERQAFITALWAAANCPAGPRGEPPALVILAVRGDYWDECAAYPQLASALQESSFVVGPMTETELRLAITGPAGAAGLRIEDALTDAILSDLRSAGSTAQGTLPLLSQAMLLTWENRDGSKLTGHGYSQAGGIAGAVQASADAVYDALPAVQRQLAREILTRMTAASSDGRVTRRAVSRADLRAGHPGTGGDQVDAILEAFAARRLLVLGEGTAEISHDALLHAWPRFHGWLQEDQASRILHSQLTEDASTWRDHDDDPSFLYRGTQLAAVREGAARWSADPARYPALTGTEHEFLDAATRAASRAARRWRIVSVALVLLLVASLAGAGVAIDAASTARQQTALAASGQLAVQSEALDNTDLVTASLLAVAALRIDPDNPQARDSLLDVYAQPGHAIVNAGRGDAFGRGVSEVAFSQNGQTLATAGSDGTVRLWNVATHRQAGAITIPDSGLGIKGVAISPNGETLATEDGDGTVRLWNTTTHRQADRPIVLARNGLGVNAVAFSPDGGLAVAYGGTVDLLDVTTHRVLARAAMPFPGITSNGVAFSQNGAIMATAVGDGTGKDMAVLLWSTATFTQIGAPIIVPGSSGLGVTGVTISPNGVLATAGKGGTVRLWDVATHGEIGAPITVPGGGSGINGVAFSPNGQTLATAGSDGIARLWNVAAYSQIGGPLAVPGSNGYGVNGVAFSPNGQTMATAGSDGAVRLWNTTTHHPAGTITVPPGSGPGVSEVAFSPDGSTLATAVFGGAVRLWNTTTRRQAGAITIPGSYSVNGIAFSPNGTLATADTDGTVRLWDPATHRQTGTITIPGSNSVIGINAVAFSPNGTLATADSNGTIRLWNVATDSQIGAPLTLPSSVNGMAFSPNGEILATATRDAAVRLWDPASHNQIGASITVPGVTNLGVSGVGFSPSGTLATAGSDGTVRLWDTAFPGSLLKAACDIADSSLTRQQWSIDVPSEPFQEVCP